MMISHNLTCSIFNGGDGIPSVSFCSHGVEKFRVFLAHFDGSNGTMLFPVDKLQTKDIFKMKLNDFTKVYLRPSEHPKLLQAIKVQDHLVSINNEGFNF